MNDTPEFRNRLGRLYDWLDNRGQYDLPPGEQAMRLVTLAVTVAFMLLIVLVGVCSEASSASSPVTPATTQAR
jgi:hypothetical protein